MANMRIVYNNAANRAATLVASTTAGSLVASNLLTDFKSQVWRSTGLSVTLTLTWNAPETISCVALPFCNLSANAGVRVQGYTNVGDVTAVFTTPYVQVAPTSVESEFDTGVPNGVNNYAYGGGAYADMWFTPASVQKIVITILDMTNVMGYIEASRLIVGDYWSPEVNIGYDSTRLGLQEDSKHERADSGDLHTDRGTVFRRLGFELGFMTVSDRNAVWKILRANGMSKPLYVSLVPGSTDQVDENIFRIYGKLSNSSAIQYKFMGQYATSFQLDEI